MRYSRLLWLGMMLVAVVAWSGDAYALWDGIEGHGSGTGGEPTLDEWWEYRFGVGSNPNNYDLNGNFPNNPPGYNWGVGGDEIALGNLGSVEWLNGWYSYTYLEVEYSGWETASSFGYYDYSGDEGAMARNTTPIFTGIDSDGTRYPSPSGSWTVPTGYFGFWMDVTNSPFLSQYGGMWYTGYAHNDAVDGGTGPDNEGLYQQCRVFQHPEYDGGWGWILAWADWDGSQIEAQGQATTEPDFQDLIVSFVALDEYGKEHPVPELGTWTLLLATGAFGGWIKRRRRKD